MLPSVALLFSAVVVGAVAQQNNPFTFPPYFNIGSVSSTTLAQWCLAERNSCPPICGGVASSNTCDPSTLQFSCVCANGTMANVAPYEQTIPSLVCQENYSGCIAANVGNLTGQNQCQAAQKLCGTQKVSTGGSTTASSSSMVTSSTPTASASGGGSSSSASASPSATAKSGAAAVMQSSSVVLGALFAFAGVDLVIRWQ